LPARAYRAISMLCLAVASFGSIFSTASQSLMANLWLPIL